MRTPQMLLALTLMFSAGCGGGPEKELKKLQNKDAASSAQEAEEMYNEVKVFVEGLRQQEEPIPKGVLADAILLESKRASEWGRASLAEFDFRGALRAFGKSGEGRADSSGLSTTGRLVDKLQRWLDPAGEDTAIKKDTLNRGGSR